MPVQSNVINMLATIDLSKADLESFEAYETKVLGLLERYGASLLFRVRSTDGLSEIHLLEFPNITAFNDFRNDPARAGAMHLWERSGASSIVVEVNNLLS